MLWSLFELMRTTVYAPFWIRASSGGASGSLQLTGLLVTGCSTFCFPSVAAPATKITPLNQTKTVALPTSALSPKVLSKLVVRSRPCSTKIKTWSKRYVVNSTLLYLSPIYPTPPYSFFGFSVDRPQSLFDSNLKKFEFYSQAWLASFSGDMQRHED